MMRNFCNLIIFSSLAFLGAACGSVDSERDGQSVGTANALSCAIENDCDEDGVFAICDEDDNDPESAEILADCDEDEDGFVDTACTVFDDVDGDGFFGDAERLEYGVNCDVCPGMTDPEQEDEDGDGVGDICVIEPSIQQNAAAPADDYFETVPSDDSAEESIGDSSVVITPLN